MKIVFGGIACSLLGCALFASSWLASTSAQDLRLRNQPTLAVPQRSSVELRTMPTFSAQKQTSTPVGSTPVGSMQPHAFSSQPAPASSSYAPNAPAGTSAGTSKWAPLPASAPLTTTVDSVSSRPAPTTIPAAETPVRLSVGTLSPTPEMWFYEQMKQEANNPEMIVRRRAEQAAVERKARIAAREWYGVSLSRPTANVTPFMYQYSPSWGSNTRHPYVWAAPRYTGPIVVEAQRPYVGVSGFGTW